MDNTTIERAAWAVHEGDAEVMATSITFADNTKQHYYIFKCKNSEEERQVPIPMWVFTKINGKGRNNRFNVIAVYNDFYVEVDLNKEHVVNPDKDGNMCISFKEADNISEFDDSLVPFEESDAFDNLSRYQIERIMTRLKKELETTKEKNNEDDFPF